jgi:predicted protein tyrosine phosphatase
VCSRNRWRSLTAEKIFEGSPHFQIRSAGTADNARIRVSAGHIGWADWIFVMEKKHEQALRRKFAQAIDQKTLICLHIEDQYQFMDSELIEILRTRVSEYLLID